MKKFLKIIRNILLVIVCFLILTTTVNTILLHSEKKKYKPIGDLIEVYDNEYIHSVKIGNGDYTIVILAGLAQPAPYYEFYNLATKLSEDYSVIILEQFGYGYSSISKKERTLENYEKEINTVLNHYNITNNVILMPHSFSGLTSLYYANKHTDSVKGIVCMDCTTSYQYEDMKDNGTTPLILKYISPLGITRLAINTFTKNLFDDYMSDIPKEYHNATKYIINSKYMNETIINETNSLVSILKELQDVKYNDNLYVTNVLANDTVNETSLAVDWQQAHTNLITNSAIQKNVILNGNHMIYQNNVDKIYDITKEMIDSIKGLEN